MSKIAPNANVHISDDVRQYVEGAGSAAKNVHINFDELAIVSDELEATVQEVTFSPTNLAEYFYNIGGEDWKTKQPKGPWLPKPELINEIADKCGIRGCAAIESEPLYEEVDWSRVTHPGDLGAKPDIRKIKVGHRVVKAAERRMADGSWRQSSPRESYYNVWDRCTELWSKEEVATEGYSKVQTGPYTDRWNKQKNGPHYVNGFGKTDEPKYYTSYQRNAHFDAEMKFAQAKADTKAPGKCVRELAGLQTGYATEDLKDGKLVFYRIQASKEAIKLDAMAHRQAIASGNTSGAISAAAALGGPAAAKEAAGALPAPTQDAPSFELETEPEEPKGPAPYETMLETLKAYQDQTELDEDSTAKLGELLDQLQYNGADFFGEPKRWNYGIKWVEYIEGFPGVKRLDHGLEAL